MHSKTMTAREMALTSHNLSKDGNSATLSDGTVYKWSDHFRVWAGPFQRTSGDAKAPKRSTADRIVDSVADHNGTTSPGLLASDLGLSAETVKRHLAKLGDRVEVGWDGVALQLTDAEQRTRAALRPLDALVVQLGGPQ